MKYDLIEVRNWDENFVLVLRVDGRLVKIPEEEIKKMQKYMMNTLEYLIKAQTTNKIK